MSYHVYRLDVGPYYIWGSATVHKQREYAHKWTADRQEHGNPWLQRVYNKYRTMKYTIVEHFDTRVEAYDAEDVLILRDRGVDPHCMNMNNAVGASVMEDWTLDTLGHSIMERARSFVSNKVATGRLPDWYTYDANDLVQDIAEVMFSAYHTWDEAGGQSRSAWMIQIAGYRWHDKLRVGQAMCVSHDAYWDIHKFKAAREEILYAKA